MRNKRFPLYDLIFTLINAIISEMENIILDFNGCQAILETLDSVIL